MFDDDFNLFSKPSINAVHIQNNLGENSCYINCMLHSIYYFKYFKSEIKKLYLSKPSPHTNLLLEFQLYKNSTEVTVLLDPTPLKTEIAAYFKKEERYQINDKGDPIELLQFFFNAFHSYIANKDGSITSSDTRCSPKCFIHKSFFIELAETMICPKCAQPITLNYDNNYFIYEMYTAELCRLFLEKKMTNDLIQGKLLQLSKQAINETSNFCETHKTEKMIKKLTCHSSSKYLLLHLVWSSQRPSAELIQFILALISFNVSIEDLFELKPDMQSKQYELSGMILYWNTHYVSVFYDNGVWLLYDDQNVEQLESWEMLINHLLMNRYQPICLYYTEKEYENIINENVISQDENIEMKSNLELQSNEQKKQKQKEELSEILKPIQISNPSEKKQFINTKIIISPSKKNDKESDCNKKILSNHKNSKGNKIENNETKIMQIPQESEISFINIGQSNSFQTQKNINSKDYKNISFCYNCKYERHVNDVICSNCRIDFTHPSKTESYFQKSRQQNLQEQKEKNKKHSKKTSNQENNKLKSSTNPDSANINSNYNQTISYLKDSQNSKK